MGDDEYAGHRALIDESLAPPFDRTSMLRRVSSEPVMGVLLQRALLMEIAHPKVGTGVDDHSSFTTEPLRRGLSTADAAIRLVFGDRRTALDAAEHVYRVHDHIQGGLAQPMTGVEPPAAYTAHDASLIAWVWATLVDNSELAYNRWVRPFAPGEADAFYRDQLRWAGFFGVPVDLLPPDRQAFARYLETMLDDPALGSSEVSRRVANQVLYPPSWTVPGPLVRPLRSLSLLLLDERLRDRLQIRFDDRDRRYAELLDRRLARHYRRLPMARTWGPDVYLALRRPVAAAAGVVGLPCAGVGRRAQAVAARARSWGPLAG